MVHRNPSPYQLTRWNKIFIDTVRQYIFLLGHSRLFIAWPNYPFHYIELYKVLGHSPTLGRQDNSKYALHYKYDFYGMALLN